MNQQPKKKTLKEFIQEFELRKRFTPSLHHLEIKYLDHFKRARRVMYN